MLVTGLVMADALDPAFASTTAVKLCSPSRRQRQMRLHHGFAASCHDERSTDADSLFSSTTG
jgi:hypothetical protein